MGRLSMMFANFMRGRYGMDSFNRFLLIIAFVIIILDLFVAWRWSDALTIILLGYIYARMFSRNIPRRAAETQKFLAMTNSFRKGNGGGAKSFSGFGGSRDKTHKIFKCPGCGSKLRVPKGAGNIIISCPHCNSKFNKTV